jgi:hypothetical protein
MERAMLTGTRDRIEEAVVVGEHVRVMSSAGESEDEVTRIIMRSTADGIWLVETTRHGRVVIIPGRNEAQSSRAVSETTLDARM